MLSRKLFKISRKAIHRLNLYKNRALTVKPRFLFSETQEQNTEDNSNLHLRDTEEFSFKTETKKLLHIVAHSIYTDKDVFVRELLSNCSDAIEKERYLELTGQSTSTDPLQINIMTNEEKRQLIIQDTGIGMTKQEMIDNLGSIASSGSKKFLENLEGDGVGSSEIQQNMIGQFGVGFYSSFIVGDTVQVISRREGEEEAHVWVSDGSGSYSISTTEDFHLDRGTKIIINLKPEYANYSQSEEIKKIIDKFSNFIQHPIYLNHEKINIVTALWMRNKQEVTEEEYRTFYEYLSKTKLDYKYKVHYSVDVPLAIKALLYVPSTNSEAFGMQSNEVDLQLFCRKVLIKSQARELLPNYLRFVKGVVDCEDLPLNISRENYQDSGIIVKMRSLLTKRILRLLEQESKRDEAAYNVWHKEFHMYLKEGLHSDHENSQLLLSLSRFNSTFGDTKSLNDYIDNMKEGQKTIYYFLAPSKEIAQYSPFMEPFTKNEVPVLFISISVEEMIFKQIGKYKDYNFVNIEEQDAEIPKALLKDKQEVDVDKEKLPEAEINSFQNWIKQELSHAVSNVVVSKKLSNSPAMIVSNMTSGMRQMMAFMNQGGEMMDMAKNLTLEINPEHPAIIGINKLRKRDPKEASNNMKQILDLCLLTVGIPFDIKTFMNRSNALIEKNLSMSLGELDIDPTVTEAEVIEDEVQIEDDNTKTKIEFDENGEPVIKRNK